MKAIKLHPKFINAWKGMYITYTMLDDIQKALNCVNESIRIDPAFTYFPKTEKLMGKNNKNQFVILKLRLTKEEINIEEYNKLKKINEEY